VLYERRCKHVDYDSRAGQIHYFLRTDVFGWEGKFMEKGEKGQEEQIVHKY
jgi:hypothetical protein